MIHLWAALMMPVLAAVPVHAAERLTITDDWVVVAFEKPKGGSQPLRISDIIGTTASEALVNDLDTRPLRDDPFCKSRGRVRKPARKPQYLNRPATYRVRPGDLLEISIWKEPDMRRETLVLPDGTISYPLAGHTRVVGLTPSEIERLLSKRLVKYFKNPFISVIVKKTTGNQIYVLGQVHNPGAFTIVQPTDVMQALSLAGGLSEFADKGDIMVLRRLENGEQKVIPFKYSSVQRGKNLSTNVMLISGDTVIVPERGLF